MKSDSQSNTILNNKIKKKSIKKNESARLTFKTCNLSYDMGTV